VNLAGSRSSSHPASRIASGRSSPRRSSAARRAACASGSSGQHRAAARAQLRARHGADRLTWSRLLDERTAALSVPGTLAAGVQPGDSRELGERFCGAGEDRHGLAELGRRGRGRVVVMAAQRLLLSSAAAAPAPALWT